ncbi:MAG: 5-(carboxyamino)imidazole ribonucleotide synthase [Aaplasma endosymbiont of Hyalomma asiaticum]
MQTRRSHKNQFGPCVGIIGGGQLGRMLVAAAAKLGYRTCVYAESELDPAVCVTNFSVVGSFSNNKTLQEFASCVDVAIVEFENIPISFMEEIQQTVRVCPGRRALYIAQNRIREKEHIKSLGWAVADFATVSSPAELQSALQVIGYPSVLKTAESGYDGKGQYILKDPKDTEILSHITHDQCYVLEKLVDIREELSIIVAVDGNGYHEFFPIAKNTHVDGVLYSSVAPAGISRSMELQIQKVALSVAISLELVGILAIEFFVTGDNRLLVNEIAPRPHNSGHWSIDACNVSQFEQLVRIACGLPLRKVHMTSPCMMQNIFGDNILNSEIYEDPRNSISLYGKLPRARRKMGHINTLMY